MIRRPALVLSWLALFGCVEPDPPPPELPADAVLIGDDIPRFWAAYDEGRAHDDLATSLDRGYRAPASRQLASFFERRIGSIGALVETVDRNRGYYESVRGTTLLAASGGEWWSDARAAFEVLEAIEPAAVHPPVALVIGRMNSGGTTSRSGILIGLELYSRTVSSPLDTLTPFERAVVQSPERLASLVVHEHAHVQQEALGTLRSGDGRTLLERALFEGIAELVAEELTGALALNVESEAYGRANEATLWAEFQADMAGTDISRWLYDVGRDPERPGDLGYFVGARIARAYVDARGDRDAAIRELLRASDAVAILDASGYAP